MFDGIDDRGDIEAESLLLVILGLVVVWIALEVISELLGLLGWLLGPFKPVLGLAIVVIIVLWLTDRL
ncbi:DUF7554 family protein [Haloarchaeobius iranensis]|uniref:Uncharacterized protein n=1 Tax=Haloarchaeobius iranensis TaxID=996166 RepID=A0A1G9VKY6_9EURY|nr:hypothetical protein [Haloarchaeobius iranensis]SDM72854.1 hypothetical protein SAMN05192554_106169 [Haloarchaeobius iranensis]